MKKNMKCTIIIPSLNPNDKLLKLVSELLENGFKDIFVINDGNLEATGTHEQLLENCTLYKNMWEAHSMAKDDGGADIDIVSKVGKEAAYA